MTTPAEIPSERLDQYGEDVYDRVRMLRRNVQGQILDWATALEMNHESAPLVAKDMREWLRKL